MELCATSAKKAALEFEKICDRLNVIQFPAQTICLLQIMLDFTVSLVVVVVVTWKSMSD